MKKLAILMVLVLCVVMLGGCMGSGAGSSVADAVAFIRFDAEHDVNLTVNKDNKVIAVTYGVNDSTPVTKDETAYKDSVLVEKTLEEAFGEIVKVNGEDLATLNVKIVSATGKEDAINSLKEELPKTIKKVLGDKECSVKITYTLDNKTDNPVQY